MIHTTPARVYEDLILNMSSVGKEATESLNQYLSCKNGVSKTFPWKCHEMLSAVEMEGLQHVVSWCPHGRAFKVFNRSLFTELILPRFFEMKKYPSFQRQLNLYGFQRISKGPDKDASYHPMFLKGQPDLIDNITRVQINGKRVRQKPDPSKEPNFYRMTCSQSQRKILSSAFTNLNSLLGQYTQDTLREAYSVLAPTPVQSFCLPEPTPIEEIQRSLLDDIAISSTELEQLDSAQTIDFETIFDI